MLEILFYQTEQGRQPVIEYIDELDQSDRAQIIADFELIKKARTQGRSCVNEKAAGWAV